MNLNDLLAQPKPIHPVELEQNGLKYYTDHIYVWYVDKDEKLYAFNQNAQKPFLDFYAKFNNEKEKKE